MSFYYDYDPFTPSDYDTKESIFIGLDIETTGTKPAIHSLIQIGVCSLNLVESYSSDVKPPIDYAYDEESLKVTGFTHDRMSKAHAAFVVDTALYHRLTAPEFGLTKNTAGKWKQRLVAIGWNVGSFDMQFFDKTFPETAELFSYRSVDLNSIVYYLERITGIKAEKLKKQAKAYAVERLAAFGFVEQWHDALYDAQASVAAWEYLDLQVRRMWELVKHVQRDF